MKVLEINRRSSLAINWMNKPAQTFRNNRPFGKVNRKFRIRRVDGWVKLAVGFLIG